LLTRRSVPFSNDKVAEKPLPNEKVYANRFTSALAGSSKRRSPKFGAGKSGLEKNDTARPAVRPPNWTKACEISGLVELKP